jgi:hypothetical protein
MKCKTCDAEMGKATITVRAKGKRGKELPPVSIAPPPYCSRACRDAAETAPKGKPEPIVEPANLA